MQHDRDTPTSSPASLRAETVSLQQLGDQLVNAVFYLLDGREPTEDLADLIAAWEEARERDHELLDESPPVID